MATGFVGSPIEWRAQESDPWQLTHPDGDPRDVMAKELRRRMEACPGGGSRFGALSVVLSDMGFFWQMYTPPYVILLIRTFLTLEGIAGQVDPEFNIYEVALPWAVQRALSPSTASGTRTLRDSLLTDANRFQWDRVEDLLEAQRAQAEEDARLEEECIVPEATSSRARLMAGEADKGNALDPALASAGAELQAAQAATPMESLVAVFGSASGATLRRIAKDLDSTQLFLDLRAPANREARRYAVTQLEGTLFAGASKAMGNLGSGLKSITKRLNRGRAVVAAADVTSSQENDVVPQAWPTSEVAARMEAQRKLRAKQAIRLILRSHWTRQVEAGWRGLAAVLSLLAVVLRIASAGITKASLRIIAAACAAVSVRTLVWGRNRWDDVTRGGGETDVTKTKAAA
uniref:Uncharacterized protein n=2 Tax=Octactis speculum TaxID=3111310 RepID=A0A7S2AWZ8_9STRA